ncbi:DUF4389 domain-containing protein [Sneathiella sp. CAU 1612]|uniref:DUF4389 domain-containing protein n=1 Tax=Sneathiella sedimenti TaxID=2816034 RepID=A0ABS3F6H4_9PROT|nr:DUF4389 domain-containing protein [Sneathiella sedimenti]MBO0334081.1 DUF4389 domain-containing protein [Sneathiella sedimenti]
MTDDVKKHVKSKTTWTRLIYLILYAIIFRVASIVLFAITIIQFLKALLTGSPFERVQSFGGALAEYNKQLVAFLSYQSDEKPFPVGPWPPETPPATGNDTSDDVIIVADEASDKPKPSEDANNDKGSNNA